MANVAADFSVVICGFEELRGLARRLGPRRVAVVMAEDEVALQAAAGALELGIATPVLIGDRERIQKCAHEGGLEKLIAGAEFRDAASSTDAAALAAKMARAGEADILLKGHLRTDELLHCVLDRQYELRTDRLLSDVLLYEDTLSGQRRLVGITDGGLNVAPTLEQKRQILMNALEVLRAIGMERPRVAIMSATEAVTPAVPSTVDAQALTQAAAAGDFGACQVFGPLALDNALTEWAAKAKGITNPVAGHADCMLVPNIESGNLLGKAVKYLGGSQCAHVVAGARVPVLIPSRVESADDKVNAMALGVIYSAYATSVRK